jgi:CoA:oxalate CoA-transferase
MGDHVPALQGIRVLDLGRILSGPLCGRILADLGAEVIKVESLGGDDGRQFGPFYSGDSSYHRMLNRNKFGITLDLKDDTDRGRLWGLVRRSDVLIENFRPGVMDRLGLSPATLLERNPGLVIVSISGYGQSGPLSGNPAYDLIVQAMSGLMSVTGPDGGPGVRVGISVGDIVPGMFGAMAALAALHERDRTGRGQHVDVAMFDGLLSVLESVGMRALLTDEEIIPSGGHHSISAPFGTFATKDHPVAIAVANDSLFARLAEALGRPEWKDDARFTSDERRGRHRRDLQREIEGVLEGLTRGETIERLEAAGIPCGPVLDVRQALSHPQAAARGIVRTEPDGFRTLDNGFRITGSLQEFRPAPSLGQHNHLIEAWLDEEPHNPDGTDDTSV